MEIIVCASIGFAIDLILGDPHFIPHPVQFIGRLITGFEKLLRKIFKGSNRKEFVGGIFLTFMVMICTFLVAFGLLKGADLIDHRLKIALEIVFCYQIFATKSLRKESMRVYKEIEKEDLEGARKYLSWIVGRDTAELSFVQITKAVIETVAENASDGVIAPMMFMLIGGAPLAFLYKAVNTLDSMVGYKNDKYLYFGRFSAKLDDVFNYIPARITAFAFILASFILGYDGKGAYRIYNRDRRNHASPNSGHPESACAGALGIQLAGDAYYFGKLYKKQTIGDNTKPVSKEDIIRINNLMYTASILVLFVTIALRFIWEYI